RWVTAIYGGVGYEPQRRALRKGADIVVACPGRLADLIREGAISLADVELVVVDEADRMADMGFLPEVRRLLDMTSPRRQTLLFSATLDGDVAVLTRDYQSSPARHDVAGA
ncbi:MAG: DEAD/DEAH box helicase, partial [Gemmatimonadetes bacterium]|nr:DEAD/DEAH box helicase [Gemmatimonadota bacterium]NIX45958.1 DEAD/DEAH box helicase [Gemmatimonadota bacterium]